ncbi:iron-hydroxamate ABC transporter substrate-binding protein [Paenibacillus flagellatus]|uniref:Iron(3+)-hydroxamate-binding protein fhuD n=1 Tax=Paenibacillus flagellatus TaxID=2211139 RepID=A0A2V5KWD1_9BACL|nr:iron-hydroxamate ABC transporter substrate-binding protein [Paenibacillus flagellatus]PYI53996.1 iron(3+)-hydroxamate-binding protein fhuD [Paenibacillus flagellatus]
MRNRQLQRYGLFLVLAMALAVLSACGQGSSGPSAPDSSSSPAPAAGSSGQGASGDANETITYRAANGEVQIPKHPKRVVELANSYVGHLLTLGIKPVGVKQQAADNPYFKGKLDGVDNLGDGQSIEKILQLQPDLIIVLSIVEPAVLEKLSKIAPTVAIEYGKLPVREQLLEFGRMTGNEDKAKAWIERWDRKIADYRPKVKAAVGDGTVSILQPYAKGIYAFGHSFARGGEIVYGEFQLKAPPIIQKEAIDSGKGYASLSLEQLPDYAGDYVFTSPWTGDTADPEVTYGSAVWKNLPAVKNGRVFTIDRQGSLFNDPVSLEEQLEFIVGKLTGANGS